MRIASVALAVAFGLAALSAQQPNPLPPAGNSSLAGTDSSGQIVPPSGAKDINAPGEGASGSYGAAGNSSPGEALGGTTAPAYRPSAAISQPAGVVRVYISNLNGADAQAIAGLLTQALFDSKQVVITENQSNASLILSGRVWRQAGSKPRRTAAKSRHTVHRQAGSSHAASSTASSAASVDGLTPPANAVPLPDSGSGQDAAPGIGSSGRGGMEGASSLSGSLPDLSSLGGLNGLTGLGGLGNSNTPADLSAYRYRLDLQLVDPQGDLVWMSGRGDQALPFEPAQQAVEQTVKPMLTAIHTLLPATGATANTAP